MKLAEILREDNALMILSDAQIEWWKTYACLQGSTKAIPYDLGELIEKHFKTGAPYKTRKKLWGLELQYPKSKEIGEIPISAEQLMHYFPTLRKSIFIQSGIITASTKLPRYDKLNHITLHADVVKNLKVITELNPEHLKIFSTTKFECGLLSLLKVNDFDIWFSNAHSTWRGHPTQEKNEKALQIIKEHMKDKDVVACQTELIDADLEEYAKL